MEGEDREPERRPAQDELGDTGTADKQPDPFQQEAQQLLDRMSASTAESKSTLPTLSSGNEVLLFTDPFAKRGAKSAELPVFALAGAGGEGERAEVGSRRDQQQQERGIRRPAFESKSGTDLPLPVLRLDSGAPATGEAQKEDPLPSFDDEQTRRDSLPAGMLDEIVQAALTDKDAREILRDIATADSRSIFQPYDPVLKAVEHIRQEFPDAEISRDPKVIQAYLGTDA